MSNVLRYVNEGIVAFMCPGCNMRHHVTIDGTRGWSWDHLMDKPTISPSILVKGTERLTDDEYERVMRGEEIETRRFVCHSFIRNGKIQFLGDCTHSLAGQTVDLPAVSEDEQS